MQSSLLARMRKRNTSAKAEALSFSARRRMLSADWGVIGKVVAL